MRKILEFLLQVFIGVLIFGVVIFFAARAYIKETDLRNSRHEKYIQLQINEDNKKDL